MWQWLIRVLAVVAPLLAEKIVKRVFTPASALARREKDRLKWHGLRERCKASKTEIDNVLADWMGVYMKFRTPPGEQSLEQRAQETLGWSFVHLTRLRVAVENQPMTPEQIDTAAKAIHECTDVVKATLAILDDRAVPQ